MRNNVVKRLLKESLHIESLLTELNDELDFSSFKMNDDLQPDIWDSEGNIKEDIRTNLIKIADNYWESLDLGFKYKDITLTGSLSNYNWSKYSDVDLHIIFDINKLGDNKEMVKDLLDVKTRKWNSDHDITIKGFEVELYLQPEDQPHHSTGVYSILNDEWVSKPEKQVVSLDKETIRKKYKEFVKQVNDIEKDVDNQSVINRIEKLKDKIKKMRKAGLETGGEYSVENIVFKLLRRNDIMQKLGDLSNDAFDDEYTIDEELLEEGKIANWVIAGSLALASFAPKSAIAQKYNDGDQTTKEKIFNKLKVAKDNGSEKATDFFKNVKDRFNDLKNVNQEVNTTTFSIEEMEQRAKEMGATLGIGESTDISVSIKKSLSDAKNKIGQGEQINGKIYDRRTTMKPGTDKYITYTIFKSEIINER